MKIREKIKRAQPSREDVAESKITFTKVVWAAVYWFVQNILVMLGMSRKSEKKPGRIRRTIQFFARPMAMIITLLAVISLAVGLWLIFGKEEKSNGS